MIPFSNKHNKNTERTGMKFVVGIFFLIILVIFFRLFCLQILKRQYYATMALDTHEISQIVNPERGQIFFQDSRTGETFPVGINRIYYKVYAVPKDIKKEEVNYMAEKIFEILKITADEEKDLIRSKLNKKGDPYEVIKNKIDETEKFQLENEKFKGIAFIEETYRYYPEKNWSAPLLGFSILNREQSLDGKYGIEGYWNDALNGKSGFMFGEKAAAGGWISLAGITSVDATNGEDLILTIDRSLQYKACSRLKAGLEEFAAKSASLVMVDAKSGAILAMCSLPDYDPNDFSKVTDQNVFNNNTIFTPYEPGSVFKPIVMATALEKGLVNPNSSFTDPCERQFGKYTIHNAMEKCYGQITMTQVLENSVNTGMIWVEEKMASGLLRSYIEKFGFGKKTGIQLDSEVAGNISSLDKESNLSEAQASFGQGLTVTPLQLAMAYTAFANDGQVFEPYLIKEIKHADGSVEKFEPKVNIQVISPRAAKLIRGMLTSVVENSYVYSVKMNDYYVAGKTGTAQIAAAGEYSEKTNQTFAGFAPATEPKFVMVVKYEDPQREWAESTAAVVFKDITDFALDYYGVEKDK
jgi:cell division protein FtsI/penicillin-binding protein 2